MLTQAIGTEPMASGHVELIEHGSARELKIWAKPNLCMLACVIRIFDACCMLH